MGSKGSSTSVTNQSQSWAPSSEAMTAYRNLLGQVGDLSNTPFQAYTGQRFAGFTPDQVAAQQATRDAQGVFQPYLEQASAATSAALTPTYQSVGQYMSPYVQNVVDATRANLNQNNAQQQSQLVGNAALKGALGGDRVGVMQAELARGQKLADDQTIANLYNQGYTTALGAAQTDASRSLAAGSQFNQLGASALGNTLTGINALNASGGQQQQAGQNNLDFAYQQFAEQRAYPYQQLQYLTGLTTALGSQMGGTSNSTGTSTSTPAQPNPLNSILGLGLGLASLPVTGGGSLGGLALAGLAHGGRVPYAEGGVAIPYGGGYIPSVGLSAKPMQPPAPMQMGSGGGGGQSQDGGAAGIVDQALGLAGKIKKGMAGRPTDITAPGLSVPSTAVGEIMPSLSSASAGLGAIYARGGKVLDMERDDRGIYVPRGFADGGVPGFDEMWSGGGFDYGTGASAPSFDDRWAPAAAAVEAGLFDPQGANFAPLMAGAPGAGPAMVPVPPARPAGLAAIERAAPIGLVGNEDGGVPPMAYAPPDLSGRAPSGLNPTAGLGAATPEAQSLLGRAFGLSPEANQALMAAGLGMMASRSPWLGVAVGEGGLKGMTVYAEAQKLREAAERAREQLAERRAYHQESVEQRREATRDRRDALARQAYPGEGTDETGQTVKGMYQFNPRTGEYDFKPGKVLTPRSGAGAASARTPAVLQVAEAKIAAREEARKADPSLPPLSREEAINEAQRPSRSREDTSLRERLAAKAADDEVGKFGDKSKRPEVLNKWRQYYGLPVTTPQQAAEPAPAPAAPDKGVFQRGKEWLFGADEPAKPAAPPAAAGAPAPAAKPAAGPGASAAPPAAPRNASEREVGKVYLAPDGRKVEWRGNGWKVVP